MRNRNNRITLYLDDQEMEMLKRKTRITGLDYNRLLRFLLRGYEPTQAPDDRFWEAMETIREFAGRIDEVAMTADNSADIIAIMAEARKWRHFQNEIEKAILLPKRAEHNGERRET